jgi:hypothetical protein
MYRGAAIPSEGLEIRDGWRRSRVPPQRPQSSLVKGQGISGKHCSGTFPDDTKLHMACAPKNKKTEERD